MKQNILCLLLLIICQIAYSQKRDNLRGGEKQEDGFIQDEWKVIDKDNGIYYDSENDNIIETLYGKKDYTFEEAYSDYVRISKGTCFEASLKIEPHNVIMKNCPVSDDGSFTFQGGAYCSYYGNCNYEGYIYLNGVLIKMITIAHNQSFSISQLYSSLDVSAIATPADVDLRVIVYRHCEIWRPYGVGGPYYTNKKVFDESKTMQIRSEDEPYQKVTFIKAGVIEEVCEITEATTASMLCCGSAVSYTLALQNIESSSTTTSTGFSFDLFSVKYAVNDDNSLFNTNLSWSWTHSHTQSEVLVATGAFNLTAKPGECVYPGFQVYANTYLVETFIVDCSNGHETLLSEVTEEVPVKILPAACSIPTDCPEPKIYTSQSGGLVSSSSEKKSMSCTGNIEVTPDGEGSENWTYSWEGPNGFVSTEQNLTDVPFGMYTVYVTNDCCAETMATVFLCENLSYGDWKYNSETDQYCRDIICDACDDEVQDQECDQASYGDYYFKESNLTCNRDLILSVGTVISTVSVPAVFSDSYNEFFESCERTYFCDEVAVHEEEEDAEYEDWEYDSFAEECTRLISCFDEELDEVDEGDVSIGIAESGGGCQLQVSCDGELTYIDEEDAETEWEFDDIFLECIGTVICFDEVVDEMTTDADIQEVEYDSFFGTCELVVSCDGSATYDVETSPSGGVIVGEDEYGNDLCEVYCAEIATGVVVNCSDVNFMPDGGAEFRSFSNNELLGIKSGPNPFTNNIFVENIPRNRLLSVELIEMSTGKTAMKKGLISTSGNLNIELDQLTNDGIYTIQLRSVDQQVIYSNRMIRMQ